MLKKHGRIGHHLILVGSSARTIGDLVHGLWATERGKRWLIPIAAFLCVFGLILTLAVSVEALAPFIYAIF